MTCSSTISVPLGHGHQLFARVSPSQQSADTVITLCGDVIPRATTLYYCVRMPERQPASRAVAKLAWCCLLAGVLTAALMFPLAGGIGLLSNRASSPTAPHSFWRSIPLATGEGLVSPASSDSSTTLSSPTGKKRCRIGFWDRVRSQCARSSGYRML